MHRLRLSSKALAVVGTALSTAALVSCAALPGVAPGPPAEKSVSSERLELPTPGVDGWSTAAPAKLGFRAGRLEELARHAKSTGSTCYAVLRRGQLARDWNWNQPRETPREVFSVTKSVASALVGIAAADGDLELDDKVARYVPQWRGTASSGVTIRNLLANDSGRFWSSDSDYSRMVQARDRTRYAVGLDQQHPPGTAWAYNNAAIQVLDRVLAKATGQPTDEFAEEQLFEPLGMSHTRLTRDASGRSTNVFFGMQTTCLDIARFGQLFLDKGVVDGRRLLPRRFVTASVGRSSTPLNAAYGYLWWLNRPGELRGALDAVDPTGQPVEPRDGTLVPGAPSSLYAALGLGGQTLMVDPRSRTIVVRIGALSFDETPDYGLADAAEVVTSALR
ncbi:serine hydrolase domain-containing protein [Nocardioides piscis]|uniref:Beta-lactamase family protein n=1 Tax=Nocardioides piscis TaxID=2714938 RepID=A0A6G7YJ52_9ACTN|nr:serine hydrolase domain-containing protein [Nocardioides piscis]QIK76762.1 beta-lactamase family protein [Nocardioides piscis]